MKIETQTDYSENYRVPVRYTRRGKAVLGLLGAGLAVGGVGTIVEANNGPDFQGEHQITIKQGDTVTDLALDNVEGAEDHIKATVNKIVKMNPQVFEDGKAYVDGTDIGKTAETPDSVDD